MKKGMKLIEMNWQPARRQLRQFGLISLVALPLLGWIFTSETRLGAWLFSLGKTPLVWDAGNLPVISVLGGLGLLLGVAGLLKPSLLRPVFVGVSLLAFPIGLVVSFLVVMLIFYGVFTPVSLLFRLMGRDALERGIDRNCRSYWQEKKQPSSVKRYYNQF